MTRSSRYRFSSLMEQPLSRAAVPYATAAFGRCRAPIALVALALLMGLLARPTLAQTEGGLYIAGYRFGFEQAAEQGLARNTGTQRFFVLVLPPSTAALSNTLPKSATGVRDRVVAGGGVLLVCQRDIDSGAVDAAALVAGVVAVRGFPPRGSQDLPPGARYFPGENPDSLPANNDALRRLRAACS